MEVATGWAEWQMKFCPPALWNLQGNIYQNPYVRGQDKRHTVEHTPRMPPPTLSYLLSSLWLTSFWTEQNPNWPIFQVLLARWKSGEKSRAPSRPHTHTGSFHQCGTRWHQEHKMKFKEFCPIKWRTLSIFSAKAVAFVVDIILYNKKTLLCSF